MIRLTRISQTKERTEGSSKGSHLVRDLVLVILDHVVGLGSEVQARALDYGNHVVCRLPFRHVGLESSPHQFDGLATETGQPRV